MNPLIRLSGTGWTLKEAWGISDDGLTIVGIGINPDNNQEAWIANIGAPIEPIPEPTTIILLGSGLVGLAGFRRKYRKS